MTGPGQPPAGGRPPIPPVPIAPTPNPVGAVPAVDVPTGVAPFNSPEALNPPTASPATLPPVYTEYAEPLVIAAAEWATDVNALLKGSFGSVAAWVLQNLLVQGRSGLSPSSRTNLCASHACTERHQYVGGCRAPVGGARDRRPPTPRLPKIIAAQPRSCDEYRQRRSSIY